MSDITVCSAEGCHWANLCWRAIAPRDPLYQSQFVTPPWEFDKDEGRFHCEYFWGYDAREEKNK